MKINRLESGIFTLDLACGGGIPQSSIIEFSGKEQSAKTTTALKIIAEVQAKDLTCAYIDVEHTLNPEWATKLGVNMDDLLISQPDTAEKAIDIVDALLIAQYDVGLDPQPFFVEQADVNEDGTINIIDALLVSQAYVGLIELPP